MFGFGSPSRKKLLRDIATIAEDNMSLQNRLLAANSKLTYVTGELRLAQQAEIEIRRLAVDMCGVSVSVSSITWESHIRAIREKWECIISELRDARDNYTTISGTAPNQDPPE